MKKPPTDPATILADLVRCRSVTPAEGGALDYLGQLLGEAGFTATRLTFSEPGTPDIENLFATIGAGPPHLVFCGHTDVVPAGDERLWTHPPFAAEIADGMLFGRGAVDMKGDIAAFAAAAFAHLANGRPAGTLSLLITGDEEAQAINGTVKLIAWARDQGHHFDAALVGEPTSRAYLGDMIKIGRRGSLSGTIRVFGRQGHVAYPHLAENPVTGLVRMLARLTAAKLDEGSPAFQPSNLEVISLDVGNPTFNLIPAEASARFNIRFNDQWTARSLEEWLRTELAAGAGAYRFELTVVGRPSEPFLTRSEALIAGLSAAIRQETGLDPELSTTGGTSDARFFKDLCPVVEFGLVGATIHQVDERVPLVELTRLTAIYRDFLDRFFAGPARA